MAYVCMYLFIKFFLNFNAANSEGLGYQDYLLNNNNTSRLLIIYNYWNIIIKVIFLVKIIVAARDGSMTAAARCKLR